MTDTLDTLVPLIDFQLMLPGAATASQAYHKCGHSVEGPPLQTVDQEDAMYDDLDNVRHAETPELAREALIDSAVLIYKSQIEVAFREQTAGHNALLLFVGLALQLMEEQLYNAFKELGAKEAEVHTLFP